MYALTHPRAHPLLLRHLDRQRPERSHSLRTRTSTTRLAPGHEPNVSVVQRHRPQDRRELPRTMHGRERRRQGWQATTLQGLGLPPRHQGLHDPGRVSADILENATGMRLTAATVTSHKATAPAARASMARSSRTRTFRKCTRSPSCSAWRTLDPGPMALSSSSRPSPPLIWTRSMSTLR